MNSTLQPFSFLAGTVSASAGNAAWTLDQMPEPDARREVRIPVTFDRPFLAAPLVHVGLAGFDISNHDAARLLVKAEAVTPAGFDIVISTWLHTRIWRVDVNWLALGA